MGWICSSGCVNTISNVFCARILASDTASGNTDLYHQQAECERVRQERGTIEDTIGRIISLRNESDRLSRETEDLREYFGPLDFAAIGRMPADEFGSFYEGVSRKLARLARRGLFRCIRVALFRQSFERECHAIADEIRAWLSCHGLNSSLSKFDVSNLEKVRVYLDQVSRVLRYFDVTERLQESRSLVELWLLFWDERQVIKGFCDTLEIASVRYRSSQER